MRRRRRAHGELGHDRRSGGDHHGRAGGDDDRPAAASTGPLLKTADDATLGKIVVDGGGYTVYTWDRDTTSTSGCTGGCAGTWPAVLVPDGTPTPIPADGVTGTLASSARSDGGGNQLTLDGKPLYRYAADAAPGEAKGDGVGGVWHVVKVA